MRKSIQVALVGTAGAIVLTAVSVTLPAQSTENTTTQPVGVERPTPSVSTGSATVSASPEIGTATSRPKPKSSESASGAPKQKRQEKTHKSATPKPKASPSAVRVQPSATPTRRVEKVTTIGSYRNCSGFAQSCIDKGYLTQYNPGQVTLAGHNYMGYQWMSRLPVGRTVKVTSGALTGTYKVYAHAWSARARKGGKFPSAGYSADLVLQTCEPNGTGYSLLRRV